MDGSCGGSHHMRVGVEPRGAVVPAAPLVSIRDTTVRTVRTDQRWARGYSMTSVEKKSTAPREILLDCSVRSSFWIFSTLRLAASQCISTEWLLSGCVSPLCGVAALLVCSNCVHSSDLGYFMNMIGDKCTKMTDSCLICLARLRAIMFCPSSVTLRALPLLLC